MAVSLVLAVLEIMFTFTGSNKHIFDQITFGINSLLCDLKPNWSGIHYNLGFYIAFFTVTVPPCKYYTQPYSYQTELSTISFPVLIGVPSVAGGRGGGFGGLGSGLSRGDE